MVNGLQRGILKKYQNDIDFAIGVYNFLKKSLLNINETSPFRGPKKFNDEKYTYVNEIEGNIKEFKGVEYILKNDAAVYRLNYGGRLIKFK